MDENIRTLRHIAKELQDDFKEAKHLRKANNFTPEEKSYFMTRCKQAEGAISATKNILENIKFLSKSDEE